SEDDSSSQSVSTGINLGSISDYSDGTIEAANAGFFAWEEDDLAEAEPSLERAASKVHRDSLFRYAFILLLPEHLLGSADMEEDIMHAGDLMLQAAMRYDTDATDYLETLDDV